MITITKKEEVVLNQIRNFILEYDNEIPEDVIKEKLGFYEYDLNRILNILNEKNLIEYRNNIIQLNEPNKEIKTVNTLKDVKKVELGLKEKESLKIIENLVNEDNIVSRYILEGNLLYGDLKLTDFRMYHILLSLENKQIIKPIKKDDGDYYLLLS